jgi:hypothetical protein
MGTKIEFMPFSQGEAAKAFSLTDWFRWAFGSYCEDKDKIEVYTDIHLKEYEFFGKGNIEEWLSRNISATVAHELIHRFAPDWCRVPSGCCHQCPVSECA